MKYDKKIKSLVRTIKYDCDSYLEFVDNVNECASTDRLLESIIEKTQLLKQYHEKRFDKSFIDKNKNDKGIDR